MFTNVWKFRPVHSWAIGELESWMSEMAKEGLHFYKMGSHFGKFKRGEPLELEYRIDFINENKPSDSDKNEPSDEQIQAFRQLGWDYVTSYKKFHVYSSPKKRNAMELPINTKKHLQALQKEKKSCLLAIGGALLLFLLTLGALIYAHFKGIPIILSLVEGLSSTQPVAIIPLIVTVYVQTRDYLVVSRLQNTIKNGFMIDHHAEWMGNGVKRVTAYVFWGILVVTSLSIPLIQIWSKNSETLPVEETDHVVVRLDMIEEPEFRSMLSVDNTYGSNLTSSWSFFAPEIYEVYEGYYDETAVVDGQTVTLPHMYSKVFELRFSFLAKLILEDLMLENERLGKQTALKQVPHEQFDLLYIFEDGKRVEIYAIKENIVTYISYAGDQDANIIIEKLLSKIKEHSL